MDAIWKSSRFFLAKRTKKTFGLAKNGVKKWFLDLRKSGSKKWFLDWVRKSGSKKWFLDWVRKSGSKKWFLDSEVL